MDRRQHNLVVIVCHDLGRFLGCYGYDWVRSPNLDALAARGVRFSNYFCTAPQCSPSRAAMWTGHAPHATGVVGLTHNDFANDLNDDERHFARIAGEAGYQTHLFGGQHEARTVEKCGFDRIHGGGPAMKVASKFAESLSGMGEDGRPFFAEVCFFEPHRGFPSEGVEPLSPEAVDVPPFLPDIPEVRADLAAYEASISTADRAVGEIMRALSAAGRDEDTHVVFTVDHGAPFPGAKMTLYDPGIEIPLIVAGPGIETGVCDSLRSNLAFTPTMLDLLGLDVPVGLHDTSFGHELVPRPRPTDSGGSGIAVGGAWPLAGGIGGRESQAEPEVFAEKTYHTYYDPMRCIRTDRWKLIVNFEFTPIQETPPGRGESVYTAVAAAEGELPPEEQRPARHPFVELYDLTADPLERRNLAEDDRHAAVRDGLMRRLRDWMERTADPLFDGPVPQRTYIERMSRLKEL